MALTLVELQRRRFALLHIPMEREDGTMTTTGGDYFDKPRLEYSPLATRAGGDLPENDKVRRALDLVRSTEVDLLIPDEQLIDGQKNRMLYVFVVRLKDGQLLAMKHEDAERVNPEHYTVLGTWPEVIAKFDVA